jgi:hypothetical protein
VGQRPDGRPHLGRSVRDDTNVYVGCYTTAGTRTDTAFDLLYTSTRSY